MRALRDRLHKRIELRSVGTREAARLCGDHGLCGTKHCCRRFPSHEQPITLRMAKDQDLAMSSGRITGLCGRLRCCLAYEHPLYRSFRDRAPRVGRRVETPQGTGVVTGYEVLRDTCKVELGEARAVEVPIDECRELAKGVRYRRLGSCDLEVSEISLGSWLTYGGGVAREQAEACVDKAFEVGINFIDTANVYGRGAAEEFLGEALSRRERSSYVLATKLYFPMSKTDRGLSRAQVQKQIDASLERLRTDYVDLYQCHRYDEDTPLEETMEALTEVVRSGKARYLGFSEWSAGADPGGARPARRREVRLEPAAVLDALARARARGDPALRARTASRRSSGRRSPRAS